MKLTLKFAVTFLVGLSLILAVYAWLTVRRETELFSSDMRRDNRLIGQIFASAVRQLGPSATESDVQALVNSANRSEDRVRLRWIGLDTSSGSRESQELTEAQRETLVRGENVVSIDTFQKGAGHHRTYVSAPVGGRPGAVEVAEPLDEQQRYTRDTLLRITSATGAIVVVCGCLAVLIGMRLVGRPIHMLVDGFRAVALGDLAHPPRLPQRDELGELAVEFDRMCTRLSEARARLAAESAKRLEAMEQLRHADRLRTVGQLTAGVAHELGTPLNVVWARASMIARGEVDGDEAKRCATVIEEQSQRMTGIIRKLLEFARPRPPQKQAVELNQVARKTLEMFDAAARKAGVALTFETDDSASRVDVDPGQIQQVLSNLVLNAIQALPHGGKVAVGVQTERASPPADHGGQEGEYLCVYVQDDGPGIPDADRQRIFEPFFTTKDIGEGTGLGLSISRGIIQEHRGWISVASSPQKGCRFSVYLPRGSV